MKNALIVDDSPVVHKLLGGILETNGWSVLGVARNGRDGVNLYRELHPDVVFLDYTMPIMDGLEAARCIYNLNPKARVIMLTAMADSDLIQNAKAVGVQVFVKKPFDEAKIIGALGTL